MPRLFSSKVAPVTGIHDPGFYRDMAMKLRMLALQVRNSHHKIELLSTAAQFEKLAAYVATHSDASEAELASARMIDSD